MSTTQINEGRPVRIQAGATITLALVGGTTVYGLNQLEPGTANFRPGGVEVLEYLDRGAQQTPVIGDDQVSELELTLKLAETAATQLIAISQGQADATTGATVLYDLTIKVPYAKGMGTPAGQQGVLANCWFAKPGEWREGSKFDTVKLTLRSKSTKFTWTTF